MLENTPESPLACTEIKSINPKTNQPWVFIGRTVAKAEAPILWPPDAKSWLIGKDSDAGKDSRGRRRGQQRTRWLDGITDSWTWVWVNSGSWRWTGRPGVLQSVGSQSQIWLRDWTERLNWTELISGRNTAAFEKRLLLAVNSRYLCLDGDVYL